MKPEYQPSVCNVIPAPKGCVERVTKFALLIKHLLEDLI